MHRAQQRQQPIPFSLGVDWTDTANFCNARATSATIGTNPVDAVDAVYPGEATTSSIAGVGMTLDVTVVGNTVTAVAISKPR